MKDLYKDPIFYFLLAPVVVSIWPIWVSAVSLPSAARRWSQLEKGYLDAQMIITDILNIDPDRLALAEAQSKAGEFSYASAVQQAAKTCDIPPANYTLSERPPIKTSSGQETQNADVTLKQVSVARFAEFLSTIQLHWSNLQCTRLKLTRQKGSPDLWKADLDFKYYR